MSTAFAASSRAEWARWLYRSVTWIEWWPSSFWTSYNDRPLLIRKLAKLCRRSCMRTSARPACRRAVSQLWKMLTYGLPVLRFAKTYLDHRREGSCSISRMRPSPIGTQRGLPALVTGMRQSRRPTAKSSQRASSASRLRQPVFSRKATCQTVSALLLALDDDE